MPEGIPHLLSVLDFRRRRMSVRWNVTTGSWTAHEEAPALVHGIALIRPALPAVCLYGYDEKLHLQIGAAGFVLASHDPRVLCEPELISGGLRRIFSVQSAGGATHYSERYWAVSSPDFLNALAQKSADPEWRSASAAAWSTGVDSAQLRQSWA